MFEISEQLMLEHWRRFLECLISVGKVLHGICYLWSMMKNSSVSRMQRFMYSQLLCYALERWIRTQHQILLGNDSWIGSKIHYNSECWSQSTENQWNSSGIFSRIHYFGVCPRSPRVHDQNGRPITIPRTIYLHVSMFNETIWWFTYNERECIVYATFVILFARKISSRTLVILRIWIVKEVVLYIHW